jgi:hypothetical protein
VDPFNQTINKALGELGVDTSRNSGGNMPKAFENRKKLDDGLLAAHPDIPLEFHTKTFTVFRPWENCSRCLRNLESGEVIVPNDGDYMCPHTNLDTYESLMNQSVAGKHIVLLRESYSDPELGTQYVRVEWAEPNKEEFARMERQKKKKEEDPGGG